MKARRVSSIAGFVLALAAAFVAGAWAQSQTRVIWHWPDSLDAVAAAPKFHRVLVESDHIRLIEATVQPGETEDMHGHRWPSVYAGRVNPEKGRSFLNARLHIV